MKMTSTKGPNERELQIYNKNRKEREYFQDIKDPEFKFKLPLTYDGFEAMMECLCDGIDLEVDDSMRTTICGYIHHIKPDCPTSTMDELGKVLWKSISNSMTWEVDQGIKEERALEAKAKLEEEKAALLQRQQSELEKDSKGKPVRVKLAHKDLTN